MPNLKKMSEWEKQKETEQEERRVLMDTIEKGKEQKNT